MSNIDITFAGPKKGLPAFIADQELPKSVEGVILDFCAGPKDQAFEMVAVKVTGHHDPATGISRLSLEIKPS